MAKKKDRKYEAWKRTLPSNLNKEGDDYDLYGAFKAGYTMNNGIDWVDHHDEFKDNPPTFAEKQNGRWGAYHLGSRDPRTGRVLKRQHHPTFKYAIDTAGGYKNYMDPDTNEIYNLGSNQSPKKGWLSYDMLPEVTVTPQLEELRDQGFDITHYPDLVKFPKPKPYTGYAPDPSGMSIKQLLKLAKSFPKMMQYAQDNYKNLANVGDKVQEAYLKAKQTVDLGLFGYGKEKAALKKVDDLKDLMNQLDNAGDIIGPNRYKLMPDIKSIKSGNRGPLQNIDDLTEEIKFQQGLMDEAKDAVTNFDLPKNLRDFRLRNGDLAKKNIKPLQKELDDILTGKLKPMEEIDYTLQKILTKPSEDGMKYFLPSNRNLQTNPLKIPRFSKLDPAQDMLAPKLTPGESIILDQYKNPFKMNKYGGQVTKYHDGGPVHPHPHPPAITPTTNIGNWAGTTGPSSRANHLEPKPYEVTQTDLDSFESVNQDQLRYMNSPVYLERLRAEGVPNPEEIRDQRIANINNTIVQTNPNDITGATPLPYDNGQYGVNFGKDLQDVKELYPGTTARGVYSHELSHIAGGNNNPDAIAPLSEGATRQLQSTNINWQNAPWQNAEGYKAAGYGYDPFYDMTNQRELNSWKNKYPDMGLPPGTDYWDENTNSFVKLSPGGTAEIYGRPEMIAGRYNRETKAYDEDTYYVPEGYPKKEAQKYLDYLTEVDQLPKDEKAYMNNLRYKKGDPNNKETRWWKKTIGKGNEGYLNQMGLLTGPDGTVIRNDAAYQSLDERGTNLFYAGEEYGSPPMSQEKWAHNLPLEGAETGRYKVLKDSHYGTAGEAKADLDGLRDFRETNYGFKREEETTPENWQQFIKDYKKSGVKDITIERTLEQYSEEDIIKNLNTIAMESPQTGELVQAKYGGQTMNRYKKYKHGGYPKYMASGSTVGLKGQSAEDLGVGTPNPGFQIGKIMQPLLGIASTAITGSPALGMGIGELFKPVGEQDLASAAMNIGTEIIGSGKAFEASAETKALREQKLKEANAHAVGPYGSHAMGGDSRGRIEAEGGEFFVSDDGNTPISVGAGELTEVADDMYKLGGPSHDAGGMPIEAPEGYVHTKRFLSNKPLGKKYKAKNDSQVAENIAKEIAKLEAFGNSKEDIETKVRMQQQLEKELMALRDSAEQYKAMKGIDSEGKAIAKYGKYISKYPNGGKTSSQPQGIYNDPFYTYLDSQRGSILGNPVFPEMVMESDNTRTNSLLMDMDALRSMQEPIEAPFNTNENEFYLDQYRNAMYNAQPTPYRNPEFINTPEGRAAAGMAYGGYMPKYATGGDSGQTARQDYSKLWEEYEDDYNKLKFSQYGPAMINLLARTPDDIVIDKPVKEYEKTDFNPMLDRYLRSIETDERNLLREVSQSGLTGARKIAALTSASVKGDEEKGKATSYVEGLKLKDKGLENQYNLGIDKLTSQLDLQELMLNLQQEGQTAKQKAKGAEQFFTTMQNQFWDPLKFQATGTQHFNPGGQQTNPYTYMNGGRTRNSQNYLNSFYSNLLNNK